MSKTVNISNRTPQVRDEILKILGNGMRAYIVTLKALTGIEKLDLYCKYLQELKSGDFDGLTELKELDLGNNELRDLPVGVFDGLINLRHLGLGYNELRDLPVGVFDGLECLKHLNLEHNCLGKMPAKLFKDLPDDREIEIYGNENASIIESGEKGIGIGD